MEVLIAFAIISLSLTVVVDSYMNTQRAYRITADQAELTRAVTRVMEDLSVEARVSREYRCGATPSPCFGDEFNMVHIEGLNNQVAGEVVSYTLNGGAIEKTDPSGSTLAMTPPTIVITDFYVEVKGIYPDEQVQALITLTAQSATDPTKVIHVQTSFTERRY